MNKNNNLEHDLSIIFRVFTLMIFIMIIGSFLLRVTIGVIIITIFLLVDIGEMRKIDRKQKMRVLKKKN
jgi:hypothetical protein